MHNNINNTDILEIINEMDKVFVGLGSQHFSIRENYLP